MNVQPGEWLCVVEMVEKYGEAFVVEVVRDAAVYLMSQGNGFIA